MGDEQSAEVPAQVVKLAPFALRSGIVVVGRERLQQLRAKLNFVWVSADLSPNSLQECRETFACPIVQVGQSSDFDRLFALRGTKIVGFRRSSLSANLHRALKSFALARAPVPPTEEQAREA